VQNNFFIIFPVCNCFLSPVQTAWAKDFKKHALKRSTVKGFAETGLKIPIKIISQLLRKCLLPVVYSLALQNYNFEKKFCCNQKPAIFVAVKKFKKNYHEQS